MVLTECSLRELYVSYRKKGYDRQKTLRELSRFTKSYPLPHRFTDPMTLAWFTAKSERSVFGGEGLVRG